MGAHTLKSAQGLLDQDGVKDVKFLFKLEALSLPMSDLEDDLADVLSKFHDGKRTVITHLPSEELTACN